MNIEMRTKSIAAEAPLGMDYRMRRDAERAHRRNLAPGSSAKVRQNNPANEALAHANQAKDRLLADVSHELRTPLNAIIGFTGMLLMKLPGPLTADQEKQLNIVRSNSRHVLALVNDLLDVAKIEAEKFEPYIEHVHCQRVIDDALATLRPEAAHKGLALEVTMPAQEIVVSTDERALKQIVLNLVGNAIKFTDHGGVHVTLSQSKCNDKDSIAISVKDSGIGIRPADRAKLFVPFSQVDAGKTASREGTGLGLHLSKRLAEMLRGTISFESEYGKGSTFTLTFPEGLS
jgi:two-component system sensor histidine kinase/response regulator